MSMGLFRALAIFLIAAACAPAADAQVHVKGYIRKDGTYVAPYYRSTPNSSRADNFSSRGNYNPYTGQRGTQDPYRNNSYQPTYSAPPSPNSYAAPSSYSPPPPPRYSPPAIRYVPPRITYIAPAPPPSPTSVFRCIDAQGVAHYLSYPRAGCDEVAAEGITQPIAQAQRRIAFHGYPCTVDCSGHEAGYQWAERRGLEDPADCGGNSQSFIEGCEAYAAEVQQQMIEDGECEDWDEDERCG